MMASDDRDITAISTWEHSEDGRYFGGVPSRRNEPPARCYWCGGDVEDTPRFGNEATCDDCRRKGKDGR